MGTYTTPPTAVTGFGLSAADWNAKIRDSMEAIAKPNRVKVNRNASQSVGHASISNIVWTTEEYDSNNIWTPGGTADSFIIPAGGAGVWTFILDAQFTANATGGRHFGLLKNGLGFATFNGFGSATWYTGGTLTSDTLVAAGDVIKAYAYQTSGIALNVDVAYNISFSGRQVSQV